MQTHGIGTGESQLDDLRRREDLTELAIRLVINGVVVGREQVEEFHGQPLLLRQLSAVARCNEARHIIVRNGVVLPRLAAGLALSELRATDAQQFGDSASEQGVLAVPLPGHVDHHDLRRLVGEDLQRHRRGVGAGGDTLLDDGAHFRRHLLERYRFDPRHGENPHPSRRLPAGTSFVW